MALRDELKGYTICEIRPVDVAKKNIYERSVIYAARVLRANDDGTVDFTIPTYLDEQVNLERNTRYSFLFIRDHAMKYAEGVFLQRIRIDNVQMAEVKLVTSLKKLQRRDYYRLGCHIDMMFQVLNMRKEEIEDPEYMDKVIERIDDENWKLGTILDISGGGMKFVSEAPIMDFPYLYLTFFLGDDNTKQVAITGKLLSRHPVPRSLLCTHRVQFQPERSKAQDRILAYVYAQQRKIAKL